MATLMQQKLIRLSQRYALALRRHLKRGPLASLLPALFQKVARMFRRRIFRCGAIIQLFLITGPGDPMIFHAGEFSASARHRPQMFEGKIETDVAVKFPVGWIARITFMRAPDLPD